MDDPEDLEEERRASLRLATIVIVAAILGTIMVMTMITMVIMALIT